ncbi:hypothetical protein [Nocardiopsis lucentensis]|uniref:hypothetical protein n=1 Tax=Nocardiopsis lucentensis TaxID=53441 RepID=UPI00034C8EFF|nr:hypothetical protein [Nocardiopsis lucentensis]
MLVEVDSAVFAENTNALNVIRLFDLFIRDVHEWSADISQIDPVDEFFGEHVPVMRDTYRSIAMKSVAASSWRSVDRPLVRVEGGTLDDHLHDLSRPAVLLVENDSSDKSFLRAIALVLRADDILTAIKERNLDIRNGGGKHDAGRQAREQRDEFRLIPRVALLLDSDRMHPNAVTKCHRIADQAREFDVKAHVLEFRESENYVPNRVLAQSGHHRRMAETSRRLEALKELTPRQRAYFDMKDGFKRTPGKPLEPDPTHEGLFDDVPQRTLMRLSKGFGKNLTEKMETLASQGRVTESDLAVLGEDVVQELHRILDMLRTIV